MEHLEIVWRAPDEGIWETRGGRQHFTYSKMMAWVAFDRGVKAVEAFGSMGPVERWRWILAMIHAEVCGTRIQQGDGSCAGIRQRPVGRERAVDPASGILAGRGCARRGTVEAIERKLMHAGFVLRYHTAAKEDGLPPGEGAFLACSFWLADAYALTGHLAEARRLFERLVGLCNDVGLLAEEYDVCAQRMVGNFPPSVLPCRACKHSAQYRPCDEAMRATIGKRKARRGGVTSLRGPGSPS